MNEVDRHLRSRIEALLAGFRVVVLQGPRQAGKSTLARQVVRHRGGTYLSLDDPDTLAAAALDPRAVLDRPRPVVVDEVQRGGDELVRRVKLAVDANPARGQYLLTGSTRFLTVPVLSESLAGRAVFADLWPFSQGEMQGLRESFVERLLTSSAAIRALRPQPLARVEYLHRALRGGFPEVQGLDPTLWATWHDAYVATVVQRDIASFSDARKLHVLPRLLSLLAARSGQLLVKADLARAMGLHHVTLDEYLGYLETVFLVRVVPAWASSPTTARTRTPKVHLADTGLVAALLRLDEARLAAEPERSGALLESFVVNELTRQLSAAGHGETELSHLRTRDGREVDVVLEGRDGRVAAVEVKAGTVVRPADASHLRWLAERLGDRFVAGVVLNTGDRVVALDDRITLMPLSALWAAPASGLPGPGRTGPGVSPGQ